MAKFRKFIIIMLIIGAVFWGISIALRGVSVGTVAERSNDVYTDENRIIVINSNEIEDFVPEDIKEDYSQYPYVNVDNLLSAEDKEELNAYIAKCEAKIGCDIFLLLGNSPYFTGDKDGDFDKQATWIENWVKENKPGWDQPDGNVVVYFDNWSAYSGDSHCYLYPFGEYADKLPAHEREAIIESVNEDVNDNPAGAYKRMARKVTLRMIGMGMIGAYWPVGISIAIAVIIALIFMIVQLCVNAGKVTVDKATYVKGGKAKVRLSHDTFISKHTTSRHIERSSGGGGGGGGGHGGSGGSH